MHALWSIYHLGYGPNWALMWLSWVRLGESVTYLGHGVILNGRSNHGVSHCLRKHMGTCL